jgi:hemoglobin/transferrin/lactoferrin receptor protein
MLQRTLSGHAHALGAVVAVFLTGAVGLTAQSTPPASSGGESERTTQDDPHAKPKLIVTANRSELPAFDAAASIETLFHADLQARSYRTLPQALRDLPGVLVQETGVGQGSPYIRGWTGYHNVLLIDGVRLNNSVFRSGPNQYWATVDPLSIDRIEVVKGSSSVLYGSDAVGGTVQAFTKDPWTDDPGFSSGLSTFIRYASADGSLQGRGELSLGHWNDDGSHTSLLVGGDRKFFDDVEAGGGSGRLPNTGYDEWAFDTKLVHRFDEHSRLVLAHQKFRQIDAPRTHRTNAAKSWRGTAVGNDQVHDFDQDRSLSYVQYHGEDLGGAIDAIHANVSFHSQKEDLFRVRSNGRSENQGFDVDTYGFWLSFESKTQVGLLTYGFEWYRDKVDSYLLQNNPGAFDWIQGPVADAATYDLAAVFVQDRYEFDDRFDVTLGARLNYAAADADSVRDPATNAQIQIDEDWSDVVFSGRANYELVSDQLALFGGISQGFRAPNLSDLSRFDSARSNEFEIPSTDLDSEKFVSYELGVRAETERLAAQAAYFWTDVEDLITRFPTGNTRPGGETEIAKGNVGDGWIWGLELGASYRALDSFTVFGNVTYMEGMVSNYTTSLTQTTGDWLSRLMPLSGQVGVRWDEPVEQRYWGEALVRMAGDANKLSFADSTDTQRIPPGGTPGYAVLDLGAGWQVKENATLNLRCENVTDVDYRVHGSGNNLAGRSFVVLMESRF